MFIDAKQLTNIIVYYKKKSHSFIAYTGQEFKKMRLTPEKKEEYKSLHVKMKVLTWGLHNELNESAMIEDSEGIRRFNFKRFKEGKLEQLVAEWDAKDSEGNVVPINKKNLFNLAPSIAEAILTAYDDLSTPSEEEEGN